MKKPQPQKKKPVYLMMTPNVWRRIKVLAGARDMKISDLVEELLAKAIEAIPEAAQVKAIVKPVEKAS